MLSHPDQSILKELSRVSTHKVALPERDGSFYQLAEWVKLKRLLTWLLSYVLTTHRGCLVSTILDVAKKKLKNLIQGDIVMFDGAKFPHAAGEFNKLDMYSKEQWDQMENMIRTKAKSS